MREREQSFKYFKIALIGIFIFLLFPLKAVANSNESAQAITPSMLKEWDDGAKVSKKVKGSGNTYNLSVTADTTGKKEGYYSIYYYDYKDRSLSGFDGMRFHYNNPNAFSLHLNTTLTVNAKTSVTLIDHSFVILTSDDKSINETLSTQYGTIEIPAGFSGTVYVPFSQMHKSDGSSVRLSAIKSWGITTVMSQEQKAQYDIGNIAFLKNSVLARKSSYFIYALTGAETMNIPNAGSATEKYQVQVTDMDGAQVKDPVTFSLAESIAGASISPDGILEVKNSCVASELTVSVKTDKSVNSGTQKVTLNRLSAAIAKQGVPRASDVSGIIGKNSKLAIRLFPYVRVVLIIGLCLILLLVAYWFWLARKHYREIEKKLMKKIVDSDKEEKS